MIGLLKDKCCQEIAVQYVECILSDACLKTRIFAADVWLNDLATQLFCVFLKVNLFSKTERKMLQILL